jgi:hypothetical protein
MFHKRVVRYCFALVLTSAVCLAHAEVNASAIGQGLQKLSAYHLKFDDGVALLVLGTTHTNDPDDPQVQEMEAQFKAFAPTEVVVEGGKWPVAATKREAVMRYGEMGLAYYLANNHAVAATDADPEFAVEIQHVVSVHGAEMAKLFYVLRMLRQFREESDPTPLDSKVERWLTNPSFGKVPALKGVIQTLPELDTAAGKFVPSINWRDVKIGLADTKANTPQFNGVTRTSSVFRDNYLTTLLVDRLLAGKRVLVIVGLAHMDAQRAAVLPALLAK